MTPAELIAHELRMNRTQADLSDYLPHLTPEALAWITGDLAAVEAELDAAMNNPERWAREYDDPALPERFIDSLAFAAAGRLQDTFDLQIRGALAEDAACAAVQNRPRLVAVAS